MPLLSINQAFARGVLRLRKPQWSNPFDHIKLDRLSDGTLGPWLHLWCPINQELNGHDPMDMPLIVQPEAALDDMEFEPYHGPLPDSAEYRAEVARYAGCMTGGKAG